MNKILTYIDLIKQFGIRYTFFKVNYEISKKIGFLKYKFPITFNCHEYIGLEQWRMNDNQDLFFFSSLNDSNKKTFPTSIILDNFKNKILEGEIPFFHDKWLKVPIEYNIHPLSKKSYGLKHWTEIPIYDKQIGDIKYVWEKSKFSYLIYLARTDYRNHSDHSDFVFNEIKLWIHSNQPNIGPHYICSQEISIRLMNWSFLLFYYSNSESLTQELLTLILNSIQVQIDHIYKNINFSKIAVRNNHAVTECLALYLVGTYFPFLDNAQKYKADGFRWFENEVAFQFYEDGTDNQNSFNYHRVKVQLLSWFIATAKKNNDEISSIIISKAKATLKFLTHVMVDRNSGYLPNYGANDGSIYFKFNDCDYRDFRPQLYALSSLLEVECGFELNSQNIKEDAFYFNQNSFENYNVTTPANVPLIKHYENGGYLVSKNKCIFFLFKTPEFKDRFAQDDYFHFDLWYRNKNILIDTGSYLYNTTADVFNYFNGVNGHNSVSINSQNHMKKGPSFIWLKRPNHVKTLFSCLGSSILIESAMIVFYPYKHKLIRTIIVEEDNKIIQINDRVIGMKPKDELVQNWNINPEYFNSIKFAAKDYHGKKINETKGIGYFSLYYGSKSELDTIKFSTSTNEISTQITINP